MVIIAVVTAVVLVCIGALLGANWTARILQPRLDRRAAQQAEERRMLAKEWAALRPQQGGGPQRGARVVRIPFPNGARTSHRQSCATDQRV
jgi:hypothetical protein